MKHKNLHLVMFGLVLSLSACRSNPHKAEELKTNLNQAQSVSGAQQVGVKNGEMVVMDKAQISERLRDLQNSVYGLEDKVYGMRKLGSLGQYGELKSCQRKLASRQYGGTGTLVWTEPLDRVTDKEEELKIGMNEKKELVGVSEEYLKDRLQRFQGYRQILQKRSDEFEERIQSCKADLATKELDTAQSNKVMVSEAPKSIAAGKKIHQFMCGFVRPGASLKTLMLNAFSRGWLSLSDFRMEQNLIAAQLKDSSGKTKSNGLLFNGWKLAFDRGAMTVGELFSDEQDAKLTAWAFDHKKDVSGAESCLKSSDGIWNP